MIQLETAVVDRIEHTAVATAMERDIFVTHAYTAIASYAASSYAAATVGETTKEVATVVAELEAA